MEPLVKILEHIGASARCASLVRKAGSFELEELLSAELQVDIGLSELKKATDDLDTKEDIVCFILGPGKEHDVPKEDNKPPAEDEPFDDDDIEHRNEIA